MLKSKTKTFILNETKDFALEILAFIQDYKTFDEQTLLHIRLALHEAIMNALRYGGKESILKAFINTNQITIEIRQQSDINLIETEHKHKGVALIKEYTSSIFVSTDKKTLTLNFF